MLIKEIKYLTEKEEAKQKGKKVLGKSSTIFQ